MSNVIIRPGQPRKAARLKCRFAIDAAPAHPYWRVLWNRELEKAKYQAADWFVRDMAKEGWEYLSSFAWRIRGPFPVVPIVTLPRRSQQKRWHMPSRDLLAAILSGYRPDYRNGDSIIKTIPALGESERWEFELSAVFQRPVTLAEVPSAQEEREMMRT